MKRLFQIVGIVLACWLVVSWMNWGNTSPAKAGEAPSKYNALYYIMPYTRAAKLDSQDATTATFETQDGHLWMVYIDRPIADGTYVLTFERDAVTAFKWRG